MSRYLGFGSDNHSNVHPDILKAIEKANKEYTNSRDVQARCGGLD